MRAISRMRRGNMARSISMTMISTTPAGRSISPHHPGRPPQRHLRRPLAGRREDEEHLPFVVRPAARDGQWRASPCSCRPLPTWPTPTSTTRSPRHPSVPFLNMDAHQAEYQYIADNRICIASTTPTATARGVCYASWKRPMVNTRPQAIFRIYGGPERLGADLYLVALAGGRRGSPTTRSPTRDLHDEGDGAARALQRHRHRHAPGILDASRCWTRSTPTSTAAGASCTSAATASTG